MPLYEISGQDLVAHDVAEFQALELYERNDLQRLLRENIDVLGDDLLVVGEEVSNWEDSRKRIDLLAINRSGTLS
jgi:RecB family endonuclease NucS